MRILKKNKIIYTDLDESLLKDNTFYPSVLKKFLKKLFSKSFLIVILTSKTYKEVINLYKREKIKFPFSSENGACFYIPKFKNTNNLFFKKFINKKAVNSEVIKNILINLPFRFQKEFKFINELTEEEQINITKLKKNQLKEFQKREYSVSLKWLGSEQLLESFKKEILKQNLQIIFGGKVLNVSGCHNKLSALKFFQSIYTKSSHKKKYINISIGDSENDIEMLNYTLYSGIIKREDKQRIKLVNKKDNVFYSKKSAPQGWVEILSKIIKKMEKYNS